jgi:hypothetical protein
MQANQFARLARNALIIMISVTQAHTQGLLESMNVKDRLMRAGVILTI